MDTGKQPLEELEKKVALLEKELEQRTRQMEEAKQELTAFNYSVYHDLRSPLRNIFGFAHLLEKKYRERLQGQGLEYLQMIMSGVERMGRLIDDLLDLSRTGRAEMKWENVDLSAIATAILGKFHENQPEREVRFSITPDIKVTGDPHLLEVAMTHLLDNAWKFTGNNQVTVIEFGAENKGQRTVYYVKDNGAGFAMDQIYRLFNPFQRLHLESEYPGDGIGLAIVKKIVQRHNGEIHAEGSEGEGAVFSFTLGSSSE